MVDVEVEIEIISPKKVRFNDKEINVETAVFKTLVRVKEALLQYFSADKYWHGLEGNLRLLRDLNHDETTPKTIKTLRNHLLAFLENWYLVTDMPAIPPQLEQVAQARAEASRISPTIGPFPVPTAADTQLVLKADGTLRIQEVHELEARLKRCRERLEQCRDATTCQQAMDQCMNEKLDTPTTSSLAAPAAASSAVPIISMVGTTP